MAFWRKSKEVGRRLGDHVELVEKALLNFQQGMIAYCDDKDIALIDEFASKTHQLESEADDLRIQIVNELIGGALLASSRGDILEIIEHTDRLANASESVLNYIVLQRVQLPAALKPLLRAITDMSVQAVQEIKQAIHLIFTDMRSALIHTGTVRDIESKIDLQEQEFIRYLFNMDIDLAEKLLIRGVVEKITKISDWAEDLADIIDRVVAQRRV